jgi:mRNA interferase MazF
LSVPQAGQGDVWECALDPIQGHEQAGKRPCLVISTDLLGKGPSDLAIIVPITRTTRTSFDVQINPPEGGLVAVSYALPYQVRTVSRERMVNRWGHVRDATLVAVIRAVRVLIRPPA